MKPIELLAKAQVPGGGEMILQKHDRDFSIKVAGNELMNTRQHESELELARLGCAHLTEEASPRVLIGGLGLGYTLHQTLEMLGPKAHVVVAELLDAVVAWNREYLEEVNGRLLEDPRVELLMGRVQDLIGKSPGRFDAILMDIDNGPQALTHSSNRRLYSRAGIDACRASLRKGGCLAIWSSEPNKEFEQLLESRGFKVRRYRAAAYKGSKSLNRFVWVASEDESKLPPGGGEPRKPEKKPAVSARPDRKKFRKR